MLHGMAARGTVIVVGVTPPYNGALPQSTDTTAPAGVDRTGIFSVVSLTTVAHRAAERTTAAARMARFMAANGTPNRTSLLAHADFDTVNCDRYIRRLILRQSGGGENIGPALVAIDGAGEPPVAPEFRLHERRVAGPEEVAGFVARRYGDGDGPSVDARDLHVGS